MCFLLCRAVHQTITVRRLLNERSVALDGRPCAQDSWFPGYAWTIASCERCLNHLGWRFTLVRATGTPAQGTDSAATHRDRVAELMALVFGAQERIVRANIPQSAQSVQQDVQQPDGNESIGGGGSEEGSAGAQGVDSASGSESDDLGSNRSEHSNSDSDDIYGGSGESLNQSEMSTTEMTDDNVSDIDSDSGTNNIEEDSEGGDRQFASMEALLDDVPGINAVGDRSAGDDGVIGRGLVQEFW